MRIDCPRGVINNGLKEDAMGEERMNASIPRRVATAISVFVCFAVLSANPQRLAAQAAKELPPNVAALIPAAKQEGELVVFGTTMPPRDLESLSKSISAFYGFPIKLTITGALHSVKAPQVVNAVRRGVPSGVDVFWTSADIVEILTKGGAVVQFDWTQEFGLDPALKYGAFGLKCNDRLQVNVIYNTDLVKANDAPRSYRDLLDPKWRGRIAIPRSPGPWINLTPALGEAETARILTGLVRDQQVRLLPSYPDVVARVTSGEFPIGVTTDAFVEIANGAPVANAPLEKTALAPYALLIIKDTPRPALAKLWGYWAVSQKGQEALDRTRGLSMASAVGSRVWKYAQGKKVEFVNYDWAAQHSYGLRTTYGKIMGLVR
jgi:iron(III) transport system substrate-binding protein